MENGEDGQPAYTQVFEAFGRETMAVPVSPPPPQLLATLQAFNPAFTPAAPLERP